LLLPLAFASGDSELHTSQITPHLLTNAEIIRLYLPAKIEIIGEAGQPGIIRMIPNPSA